MRPMRPGKAGVRNRDHERGMILAVATIVVIAMLMMATPFLLKLSMQSRTTEKSNRSLSAFNLAEGGIDRALWEMNQPYAVTGGLVVVDAEGNGTIAPLAEEVGDRTGTVQGTITTNLGVEPNVRTITAVGGVPHIAGQPVTRTVSVNLEKYYKSVFDFGIFADEGIWGKTNVKTVQLQFGRWGLRGHPRERGCQQGASRPRRDQRQRRQRPSRSSRAEQRDLHGNLAPGRGPTRTPSTTSSMPPIRTPVFPRRRQRDERNGKIMSAPFEMPPVDLWDLPPRDMFRTELDFHGWFSSQPPVDGPLAFGYHQPGLRQRRPLLDRRRS